MSSDDTPHEPSRDDASVVPTAAAEVADARGRRDAVREKAQQVRAQQSRSRMIRRAALTASVVAVVAVVGVVVAWTVGGAASRPQLSPLGTQDDGFLVTSVSGGSAMASPDDVPSPTPTGTAEGTATPEPTDSAAPPVQIHVFVDYLSPAARDWQLANAEQLASWIDDGAATLTYHPVSMLTAKSNGTKYSLRAANAAACVATYAPDSFFEFSDDLLTRQPSVDEDGLSDDDLASIALANGSDKPKQLRECIESSAFAGWVKDATERAVSGADGVALTGTSMVTVNGQQYVGEMTDPAEFSQFVLTSASGGSREAPAPTPTVSASPTPKPSKSSKP